MLTELSLPKSGPEFKETIYDGISFICPSWNEMGELNFNLAKQIIEANPSTPPFDRIIALARGGWTWARSLADSLNVPQLSTLRIRSYSGVNSQAELRIVQPLTDSIDGERVLVFDEVIDTGSTLAKVKRYLTEMGATQIQTAGLCVKPHTTTKPDYSAFSTSAWVVFPHEVREFVEDSAKRWIDKGLTKEMVLDRFVVIGLPVDQANFYLDLFLISQKNSS